MTETICKKIGYGPNCSDKRLPQAVAEKNDCIHRGHIKCREKYWQCVLDRNKSREIKIPPISSYSTPFVGPSINPVRQWPAYISRHNPRPSAFEPFDKYFYWSVRTSPIAEDLRDLECFSEIRCFEDIKDCFCDSLAGWVCHTCDNYVSPKEILNKDAATLNSNPSNPNPNPDLISNFSDIIPIFFGAVQLSGNIIYQKQGTSKKLRDLTIGIGRGTSSYLTKIRLNGYDIVNRITNKANVPNDLLQTNFSYQQGIETAKIDANTTVSFGYCPSYRGLAHIRMTDLPVSYLTASLPTMTFSVSTGVDLSNTLTLDEGLLSGVLDILGYEPSANEVTLLYPNETRQIKLSNSQTVSVAPYTHVSLKSIKVENSPDVIYIDSNKTLRLLRDIHHPTAPISIGTVDDTTHLRKSYAILVHNIGWIIFTVVAKESGEVTIIRTNKFTGSTTSQAYTVPIGVRSVFFSNVNSDLRLYFITFNTIQGSKISSLHLTDINGYANSAINTEVATLSTSDIISTNKGLDATSVTLRTVDNKKIVWDYEIKKLISITSSIVGVVPKETILFGSPLNTSIGTVNLNGDFYSATNTTEDKAIFNFSTPKVSQNTNQLYNKNNGDIYFVTETAKLAKIGKS
jgi:hypothetical protein